MVIIKAVFSTDIYGASFGVSSVDRLALLAILGVCCGTAYVLVHRALFGALSSLPGPLYTRISSLPVLFRTFTYSRTFWIHRLHQQYGPVVRLSPTEVSISDAGLVSTVYSFEKSPWYNVFIAYGERNMFATIDRKTHSWKRKNLGAEYAKASVISSQHLPMIKERTRRFMDLIKTKEGTEVALYRMLNWVAMDVITGFVYGDEGGSDLLGDRPGERQLAEAYDLRRPLFAMCSYTPRLSKLLGRIGIGRIWHEWKLSVSANIYIQDVNLEWIARVPPDSPCLYNRLAENPNLNKNYLASETLDHIGAGQETTAITLVYLIHHLSTHPSIQDALHAELKDVNVSSFSEIDDLPYLRGVIQESLRLYTAIPASEPRIVPPSGTTFEDLYIPPGTVISAQPYTLHRDPIAFPEPELFRPERWTEADEGQTALMNRRMMAFGRGTRGCIGQNVAMVNMKLLVAAVYQDYTTRKPAVKHKDEDMTPWHDYVMMPSGEHCGIIFEKI